TPRGEPGMNKLPQRKVIASACIVAAVVGGAWLAGSPAGAQGQSREFTVRGDQFAFAPPKIEVRKDDLGKITFTANDIPHSFTIDSYRIAKRCAAGQTVVFEFRADQVGEFDYYCNLTQDDRCRGMKGKLVVR